MSLFEAHLFDERDFTTTELYVTDMLKHNFNEGSNKPEYCFVSQPSISCSS